MIDERPRSKDRHLIVKTRRSIVSRKQQSILIANQRVQILINDPLLQRKRHTIETLLPITVSCLQGINSRRVGFNFTTFPVGAGDAF